MLKKKNAREALTISTYCLVQLTFTLISHQSLFDSLEFSLIREFPFAIGIFPSVFPHSPKTWARQNDFESYKFLRQRKKQKEGEKKARSNLLTSRPFRIWIFFLLCRFAYFLQIWFTIRVVYVRYSTLQYIDGGICSTPPGRPYLSQIKYKLIAINNKRVNESWMILSTASSIFCASLCFDNLTCSKFEVVFHYYQRPFARKIYDLVTYESVYRIMSLPRLCECH